MKLFLLIIVVFLNLRICNAQRITYNNLKYVLYHNIGETEDFLSQKGFSFSKIDTLTDQDISAITYNFCKNSAQSINYISVAKTSLNSVFYESYTFTVLQNDYLSLKKSIKQLGFKLTSSDTYDNYLIVDYKKENLLVSFMIKKNLETEITSYGITLKDLSLEKKARQLSY